MCPPKVVRGIPCSACCFLIAFFRDFLIALSTSWHRVPFDCGLSVFGVHSHFGNICITILRVFVLVEVLFLNCYWKSFRTRLIDFPDRGRS